MKTIGRLPSALGVSLISATTGQALSTLSMKGRRTCRGLAGNWVRMELPKVSAVMPVPSETKNTVRSGMVDAGGGARGKWAHHDKEELLRIDGNLFRRPAPT